MLDVVIAWVQTQRGLVVENCKAELAAAVIGVAQVVIEIRIDDAFVNACAPFVNCAFKVVLVICLGAGFEAVAFVGGACCGCEEERCGDRQNNSIQFHKSVHWRFPLTSTALSTGSGGTC